MKKTTFIFHATNENGEVEILETVTTDLSFDTAVLLALNTPNMCGVENLYVSIKILAVDFAENAIELACEIG